MKKRYFLLFVFTIINLTTFSQGFHTQGNVKLFFDLNLKKGLSNARFVASAFPILYLDKRKEYFATLAPSISFQNGRGIAMSMADKPFFIRCHFLLSLSAGKQWGNRTYIHKVQTSSQYLSSSFDSDCRNIVAVTTNLICQFAKNDNKKIQLAGNIYTAFSSFEFQYLNDGPPFPKFIADGKDRWWTGSGFLGFTTRQFEQQKPLTDNLSFRLSFDRYTGYTENAFELADALKMDYALYGKKGEYLFNRGSMRLGVFNNYGSVEVSANDTDALDVQYWLHKLRGQSLHRTINESSCSIQIGGNPLQMIKK